MTSSSDHGSESNPEPLYMGVYSSYELPGHPRSFSFISWHWAWYRAGLDCIFINSHHERAQICFSNRSVNLKCSTTLKSYPAGISVSSVVASITINITLTLQSNPPGMWACMWLASTVPCWIMQRYVTKLEPGSALLLDDPQSYEWTTSWRLVIDH